MGLNDLMLKLKGGSGSGNFGHSGRPGKVGGSSPVSSFFNSSVGQSLFNLNKDYDFVVMGSTALKLHLGDKLERDPKDIDVLDLVPKKPDISSRWDKIESGVKSFNVIDRENGTQIQSLPSGEIVSTKGSEFRTPDLYNVSGEPNFITISGVKILDIKTLATQLSNQTGIRENSQNDLKSLIKAKNLSRDYLGKNIEYLIAWDEKNELY